MKSSEILSCDKQTWNSHFFFSWMFLFYRLLHCFNDVLPSFIFRIGFIVSKFSLDPWLSQTAHVLLSHAFTHDVSQWTSNNWIKASDRKRQKPQKRKKIWDKRQLLLVMITWLKSSVSLLILIDGCYNSIKFLKKYYRKNFSLLTLDTKNQSS